MNADEVLYLITILTYFKYQKDAGAFLNTKVVNMVYFKCQFDSLAKYYL